MMPVTGPITWLSGDMIENTFKTCFYVLSRNIWARPVQLKQGITYRWLSATYIRLFGAMPLSTKQCWSIVNWTLRNKPVKFRRRSKKTSKLRVTGLCAGISPVIGEFPAQMASKAKNVSVWWRHHALVASRESIKINFLKCKVLYRENNTMKFLYTDHIDSKPPLV